MLQYTKASLKSHIVFWIEGNGVDADEEFVAALDEIIQQGERQVMTDLDLDALDSVQQTTTSGTAAEVFKPENLVSERVVIITIAGVKRTLDKRHRAFVELMNAEGILGAPAYFAEFDESRWFVAPVADADYLIDVHGIYRPVSITDGNDSNTTWLSTRYPELLSAACDLFACRNLKFWGRAAAAEAEYAQKLKGLKGQSKALQRADIEDIVSGRNNINAPSDLPPTAA